MQGLEFTQYTLVSSVCRTDGAEGRTVYGIQGSFGIQGPYVLEDISADKEQVETLLHMLQKHQVSPSQLLYVVEDYIAML